MGNAVSHFGVGCLSRQFAGQLAKAVNAYTAGPARSMATRGAWRLAEAAPCAVGDVVAKSASWPCAGLLWRFAATLNLRTDARVAFKLTRRYYSRQLQYPNHLQGGRYTPKLHPNYPC